MWPKRFIIVLPIAIVLLFLGLYSWNRSSGVLDGLAEHTGLEFVGIILRSTDNVRQGIKNTWSHYIDLVDVREENDQLRKELTALQNRLILADEERAELKRLQELLSFTPPKAWEPMAARVISGRIGINAALETITLARGYLQGAVPNSPIVIADGLVGRILRAGPSTSTALLILDPGSRIAVLGQESRTQAILAGAGITKELELRFVPVDSDIKEGEILITSGLDDIFPKGVPVAKVTNIERDPAVNFISVKASPLVDFNRLEEVLLLERPSAN